MKLLHSQMSCFSSIFRFDAAEIGSVTITT